MTQGSRGTAGIARLFCLDLSNIFILILVMDLLLHFFLFSALNHSSNYLCHSPGATKTAPTDWSLFLEHTLCARDWEKKRINGQRNCGKHSRNGYQWLQRRCKKGVYVWDYFSNWGLLSKKDFKYKFNFKGRMLYTGLYFY